MELTTGLYTVRLRRGDLLAIDSRIDSSLRFELTEVDRERGGASKDSFRRDMVRIFNQT